MQLLAKILCIFLGSAWIVGAKAELVNGKPAAAPNNMEMPNDYKHWQLVGVSQRTDKHSLRVILGNPVAIAAINKKQTNPWPDGAILAKLVWKERQHPAWPTAIVPGELEHVEFMHKESAKFQKTGGWGYARWVGSGQKPFGKNADFADECVACHTAVKDKDFVFTLPAPLP